MAAAFARSGFKIIFAEIDPRTMMIDFEDTKERLLPTQLLLSLFIMVGLGQMQNYLKSFTMTIQFT